MDSGIKDPKVKDQRKLPPSVDCENGNGKMLVDPDTEESNVEPQYNHADYYADSPMNRLVIAEEEELEEVVPTPISDLSVVERKRNIVATGAGCPAKKSRMDINEIVGDQDIEVEDEHNDVMEESDDNGYSSQNEGKTAKTVRAHVSRLDAHMSANEANNNGTDSYSKVQAVESSDENASGLKATQQATGPIPVGCRRVEDYCHPSRPFPADQRTDHNGHFAWAIYGKNARVGEGTLVSCDREDKPEPPKEIPSARPTRKSATHMMPPAPPMPRTPREMKPFSHPEGSQTIVEDDSDSYEMTDSELLRRQEARRSRPSIIAPLRQPRVPTQSISQPESIQAYQPLSNRNLCPSPMPLQENPDPNPHVTFQQQSTSQCEDQTKSKGKKSTGRRNECNEEPKKTKKPRKSSEAPTPPVSMPSALDLRTFKVPIVPTNRNQEHIVNTSKSPFYVDIPSTSLTRPPAGPGRRISITGILPRELQSIPLGEYCQSRKVANEKETLELLQQLQQLLPIPSTLNTPSSLPSYQETMRQSLSTGTNGQLAASTQWGRQVIATEDRDHQLAGNPFPALLTPFDRPPVPAQTVLPNHLSSHPLIRRPQPMRPNYRATHNYHAPQAPYSPLWNPSPSVSPAPQQPGQSSHVHRQHNPVLTGPSTFRHTDVLPPQLSVSPHPTNLQRYGLHTLHTPLHPALEHMTREGFLRARLTLHHQLQELTSTSPRDMRTNSSEMSDLPRAQSVRTVKSFYEYVTNAERAKFGNNLQLDLLVSQPLDPAFMLGLYQQMLENISPPGSSVTLLPNQLASPSQTMTSGSQPGSSPALIRAVHCDSPIQPSPESFSLISRGVPIPASALLQKPVQQSRRRQTTRELQGFDPRDLPGTSAAHAGPTRSTTQPALEVSPGEPFPRLDVQIVTTQGTGTIHIDWFAIKNNKGIRMGERYNASNDGSMFQMVNRREKAVDDPKENADDTVFNFDTTQVEAFSSIPGSTRSQPVLDEIEEAANPAATYSEASTSRAISSPKEEVSPTPSRELPALTREQSMGYRDSQQASSEDGTPRVDEIAENQPQELNDQASFASDDSDAPPPNMTLRKLVDGEMKEVKPPSNFVYVEIKNKFVRMRRILFKKNQDKEDKERLEKENNKDGEEGIIGQHKYRDVATAYAFQEGYHRCSQIMMGFLSGLTCAEAVFAFNFANEALLLGGYRWMALPVHLVFVIAFTFGCVSSYDRIGFYGFSPDGIKRTLSHPGFIGIILWSMGLVASLLCIRSDEMLSPATIKPVLTSGLLLYWRILCAVRAVAACGAWLLQAFVKDGNMLGNLIKRNAEVDFETNQAVQEEKKATTPAKT